MNREERIALVEFVMGIAQANELDKSNYSIASTCEDIMADGVKLYRLAVIHCNRGELTQAETKRRDRIQNRIREKAINELGCVDVIFEGDPRGAMVKLVLKNGRSNNFGEGWAVPRFVD